MKPELIENILRKAPEIKPPAGLLPALKRDVTLPRAGMAEPEVRQRESIPWIRRWLPAAGFAAWFLGCVVVFGVQANRINELTRQQALAQEHTRTAPLSPMPGAQTGNSNAGENVAQRQDEELQALQREIEQLRKEVADLAALRAENARLQAELHARSAAMVNPEQDFFTVQKDKASRLVCINHIKQTCLAARMQANDTKAQTLTRDLNSLAQYVNGSTKLLMCGDGKTAFQVMSPGGQISDPSLVFIRCATHNNVGLFDGSAHQLSTDQKLVDIGNGYKVERN